MDPAYADAAITDHGAEWRTAGDVYCNGPRMHHDAMTVGECPNKPDIDKVLRYVSVREKQLNMGFQFDIVDLGRGKVFKLQTTPFAHPLRDLNGRSAGHKA